MVSLSTLLALAHVLGQILIFASKFSEIREDLCHVVGSSHLSSHVGPICPNAQPTWEAARAEDCFCFCFYVPGNPLGHCDNLLGKRPELKIVFVFVFMFQAVHFGHCDILLGKRPGLKINS